VACAVQVVPRVIAVHTSVTLDSTRHVSCCHCSIQAAMQCHTGAQLRSCLLAPTTTLPGCPRLPHCRQVSWPSLRVLVLLYSRSHMLTLL
jgi:hypothetical protein